MFDFFRKKPEDSKEIKADKEIGVSGTAVYGGYVETNEKNPLIANLENRYRTASDILANISVAAASVRYFLSLLSNPDWTVTPSDDSHEALEAAQFVESVMGDLNSSWSRIIRRTGIYRYHGFGIQEWTAKKRDDGKIGFTDIEQRPQHTIERWERDESGRVIGVYQLDPQSGFEIFLPRWKLIYLVDDSLTDSPEGMGWFRHLVEPATRLKEYLNLEKIGLERDLAGVPVGRAPITALNRAVKTGQLTQAQADTMLDGIKNFVKLEVKKENTGIILDSQTFENQTADGTQATSIAQWGVELLNSNSGNIAALGLAVERINVEMARIIGTENIFIGSGGSGSLALSKDKSTNLYLNVNSTLAEIAEEFNRDFIGTLWRLNGLSDAIMPTFTPGEVTAKDAESIAGVLSSMAQAGAILSPDDPAINELRALLGLPSQDDPSLDFM